MHQVHQPVSLGLLDPAEPAPMIATVIRRIRETQNARQCGSFVFIDKSLNVFVVPEERACAVEWVRDRFRELVAKYQFTGRSSTESWLAPTPEGLAEDFADHLAVNGWAV